jgi:hypothetical protein
MEKLVAKQGLTAKRDWYSNPAVSLQGQRGSSFPAHLVQESGRSAP